MPYDTVDAEIDAWVERHGLTLFREWAGGEIRCRYTSSDTECFQIVIREPNSGEVKIEAFSIETTNDEDFQQGWHIPVAKVADGLENALATVENWKRGIDRPSVSGSSTRSA
jgi:hypothetical protein